VVNAIQAMPGGGTLTVETIACGGTTADVCGSGIPFFSIPPEAYGQFTPVHIYDLPGMPTEIVTMDLPQALPTLPFDTPLSAALLGLRLTEPILYSDNPDVGGDFGWPDTRQNVSGGTGPQTNGAVWVDDDANSDPGVTNYAVPPQPGGIDYLLPEIVPPEPYDDTSSFCGLDYAWWPGLDSFLQDRRVKRFHLAARMISSLHGTIQSCGEITGDVIGPATDGSGPDPAESFRTDIRFAGCIRCASGEAYNCANTGCSDAVIDFYDEQPQDTQQVRWSAFVIRRAPSDSTCTDIRAFVIGNQVVAAMHRTSTNWQTKAFGSATITRRRSALLRVPCC